MVIYFLNTISSLTVFFLCDFGTHAVGVQCLFPLLEPWRSSVISSPNRQFSELEANALSRSHILSVQALRFGGCITAMPPRLPFLS